MSQATAVRAKQEIGQPVVSFTLPLIDGGGMRPLESFLEGKRGGVVVFWSGICSHCVRYDPYFHSFTDRHPELALLMVASRHGETAQQLDDVVAQRNLRFPIVHDPPGAVAREWYTQQTPRAYLIGPDLKLYYRGAIDNFKYPNDAEYAAYLEPAIASYLSGEPVARPETASFGCAIQSIYYILPKPI
ncbi:MAG: redoxin domain-containing protein [Bryobacteraceae bacterium]